MIIGLRRLSKFKLFEMIAQYNNLLLSSPVVRDKVVHAQYPSLVCVKVRCFISSRLTHMPKASPGEAIQSLNSASRFSRFARNEAQGVLLTYLHTTRSFAFDDAEHLSKNSPHFLQSLLSKIDCEKDVAKSLTKFLRYHPINEFEPFFESLGLSPSEVLLFLPPHMMYLSDDHVMLENYHALCDYGIPRSQIGKMYKDAKEIFGYSYGVLSMKLQAYEHLGLSRPTVNKLVSCCPSLLIGDVNSNFVNVLNKLKALEFGNDWLAGYLSIKSTYNWDRMLDTINFLDKVGYSQKQMSNLLQTNPALLLEGSGKQIYILFGRLLKLGLKMDIIYSFFMENCQILSNKCAKNLLAAIDFLFDIGMEAEYIAEIISNHMQLLCTHSLKRPKTVCMEFKVSRERLCQIIREEPLKLINLASKSKNKSNELTLCQNPIKLLEKTAFLVRLGYVENSEEMAKALRRFRGRGDQLQERFDCLVEAGLDFNVVTGIVKHAPMVLNQTKDVIEKKIDCLRNILGYELESVVAFPTFLCYDLQRINERFSMYKWLRDRDAAKVMLSLSTILACSNKRFVKYFVDVHPAGPLMWENLKHSALAR